MTPHLFSEPDRYRAFGGLFGAAVDLGLGDRAERMIDHRRHQVRQAEGFALHLGLMQEFGGDHDSGRRIRRAAAGRRRGRPGPDSRSP